MCVGPSWWIHPARGPAICHPKNLRTSLGSVKEATALVKDNIVADCDGKDFLGGRIHFSRLYMKVRFTVLLAFVFAYVSKSGWFSCIVFLMTDLLKYKFFILSSSVVSPELLWTILGLMEALPVVG